MSTLIVQSLSDIPAYEGPNAIPGIRFRAVRHALGVTSWGMNLLELAPDCDGHPEHDHAHDGQEEVYVVLSGSAVLRAAGADHPIRAGDVVRVPAEVTRKIVASSEGATVLALGGTPGQAFTPTM